MTTDSQAPLKPGLEMTETAFKNKKGAERLSFAFQKQYQWAIQAEPGGPGSALVTSH